VRRRTFTRKIGDGVKAVQRLRGAGSEQNQLSGANSGKIQGARKKYVPHAVRFRRATKKFA